MAGTKRIRRETTGKRGSLESEAEKMKDSERRMAYLKKYFSREIMQMFSEGIPENYFEEKKISYEEAVAILKHTISEVKKRPILF